MSAWGIECTACKGIIEPNQAWEKYPFPDRPPRCYCVHPIYPTCFGCGKDWEDEGRGWEDAGDGWLCPKCLDSMEEETWEIMERCQGCGTTVPQVDIRTCPFCELRFCAKCRSENSELCQGCQDALEEMVEYNDAREPPDPGENDVVCPHCGRIMESDESNCYCELSE